MIDCTEYRRSLLADPGDARPEMRAHRELCPDCAEFTRRLAGFEARLARAMRLDPEAKPLHGARAKSRFGWSRTPRRLADNRGLLAIAASLLLGVGLVMGLWLAVPRTTLADDVVKHMAGEPQAWRRTDVAVPAPKLNAVLRSAHVRLAPGAGQVTYANSCLFRGHVVPHFVVQGDNGPVTVMVLVHESVRAPVAFDEQGYRGVILPVPGHGAIAVLTRGASDDAKTVAEVAKRLLEALVWSA